MKGHGKLYNDYDHLFFAAVSLSLNRFKCELINIDFNVGVLEVKGQSKDKEVTCANEISELYVSNYMITEEY